jgi:hypothetical protein
MNKFATALGVLAIIAVFPLLFFAPTSSLKNQTGTDKVLADGPVAKADVITTPLGKLRGFSKSTGPLALVTPEEKVSAGGSEKVKGQSPAIYSSLEMKQRIPVPHIPSPGSGLYSQYTSNNGVLAAIERVKNNYGSLIAQAARETGISSKFLTAIIVVESSGNPNAQSNVGAIGLMQVMPVAKQDVGISGNLWNPSDNIRIGSAYLAKLRDNYGYNTPDAMAVAYNVGIGHAQQMTSSAMADFFYARRVNAVLSNL